MIDIKKLITKKRRNNVIFETKKKIKNVLLKVKGKEIYKSARYLVDVERLNNCSTNVSETFRFR